MKKKAVFITNIPSPYRVDFFSYMQKNFPEYEFHIIFSGAGMENRKWSVEMEEIEHYHFLKSKTIIIRKRFDDATAEKLKNLRRWDWDEEKIRHNIPAIQAGDMDTLENSL